MPAGIHIAVSTTEAHIEPSAVVDGSTNVSQHADDTNYGSGSVGEARTFIPLLPTMERPDETDTFTSDLDVSPAAHGVEPMDKATAGSSEVEQDTLAQESQASADVQTASMSESPSAQPDVIFKPHPPSTHTEDIQEIIRASIATEAPTGPSSQLKDQDSVAVEAETKAAWFEVGLRRPFLVLPNLIDALKGITKGITKYKRPTGHRCERPAAGDSTAPSS